jgi:hypothetical protein
MWNKWWKAIHWLLIFNFVLEILYGTYIVFFALGSGWMPLFGQAARMPLESIIRRRLYAIEVWLAFMGLAVYLAITEVLPRRFLVSKQGVFSVLMKAYSKVQDEEEAVGHDE